MNPFRAKQRLGRAGEEQAAEFLQRAGYRIIARNWRCPSGEIDLVAEIGDCLVFVEVRSRRNTGNFGTAAESVNGRKQRQVRETAEVYLYRNRCFDRKIRFDVIAVQWSMDGQVNEIQHIRGAF
jgi:putative endonuclease